ncbi:MAG TPA: PilZ domain-containing protein [Phycisphaerae bacterium]|nr:PilZ domain-containing protein [Phycisphaerae bacterium]
MMIHALEKSVVCERRQHPRLGFDCPLRWCADGVDQTGWTHDISEGGIGFLTRAASVPRPGQRVGVVLDLDEEREWTVDDQATVVRCESRGRGLYSVGLRLSRSFTDLVDT